ncbi:MAG: ABC transporter substrate-binding protein, partial [Alphaproteobacteria bacterium]|nr:ABC transporter substrate-binding protein [Alphaproteobacteria bacterium]
MKMRHVLSVLLAALPLGGAAYGAGGAGSETPSQPGSTIQVAMTLYAGGLTLGHVDLNTTIRGD